MSLHPIVFVLVAYGLAALIALLVAVTVKVIASLVDKGKKKPKASAAKG